MTTVSEERSGGKRLENGDGDEDERIDGQERRSTSSQQSLHDLPLVCPFVCF